jgi:hypothetical protein
MKNYKWFDLGFHPFVNIHFYCVKLKNNQFSVFRFNLFAK